MVIKEIDELKRVNEAVLYHPQPLSPFQIKVLDNQLTMIDSTMWNLSVGFKFRREAVDAQRLLHVAEKAMQLHPVLNTRIFIDAEGEFKQQICPGFVQCNLKRVMETDMEDILSQYPKPFSIINEPLVTVDIYVTPDHVYYIMEAHHIIFDSSSAWVWFNDMVSFYTDSTCCLEADLFPGFSALEQRYRETEEYQQDKAYYEETYKRFDWCNMPPQDFPLRKNVSGHLKLSLGVSLDELKEAERRCRTTRARLANAAGLLALAKYAQRDDVLITWIFHNRNEKWKANMLGLLIRELPVGVHISELDTLDDLYKAINKQIKESTKRNNYQYVVEHESTLINDSMEINYKGAFLDMDSICSHLFKLDECTEVITFDDRITEGEARLELDIYEDPKAAPQDQVYIEPVFITSIFKEENINGFFQMFRTMFQRLVKAEKTTPMAELLQ